MKLFISVKGEFHIRKRKEGSILCRLNKTKVFKTPQTGVFEGKIKWDGCQGMKENLSHPRGFGSTDAGNAEVQTVDWKCKSTWKLGLFYQASIFSCNSYSKKANMFL